VTIGILSDTHNHAGNTRIALETLRARDIHQVIHCGDITTPTIVHLFAGWQVTFVFGNMDTHRNDLIDAARLIGVKPPQYAAQVEVDGKLLGVTHGADRALLLRMTMSGKYAYVCTGHTHRRQNDYRRAYGVRVINPGALGGSRPESRSLCILDVVADEVEFVEFPEMG
jgi:putative phosphoesterase